MKKSCRLVSGLLCLLLLCSCGGSTISGADSSAEAGSVPYVPQLEEVQPVRVVLPLYSLNDQSRQLQYAQELVQKAGFQITFELFKGDVSKYIAEYESYIRENLDTNTVFIAWSALADQLSQEGLAGDFYDQSTLWAPGYTRLCADAAESGSGKMNSIPFGIDISNMNRIAVLTRKEVYDTYGKEIETADDYKALLEYLKKQKPDETPGAISPCFYDRNYISGGYTALSLFLPQYGYYSLDRLLWSYEIDTDCYGAFGSDEVYPYYEVPAFKSALLELSEWHKNGLIDFWNYRTPDANLEEYPTLVVNTEDFLSGFLRSSYPAYDQLDFAQYHLSILYSKTLPRIPDEQTPMPTAMGVAGSNAELSEFFRWLEWMETPENYLLMRCGVEGVDYTLTDGALAFLDTEVDYCTWDHRGCFVRYYLEKDLRKSNQPSNLQEALESVEYPYDVPLNAEQSKQLAAELLKDPAITSGAQENRTAAQGLIDALYGSAPLSEAEKAVDDYIAGRMEKDNLRPITQRIETAYENAKK